MIAYDLSCECGCRFEGWFRDCEEFKSQSGKGLLACPVCDGNKIRKIISPVTVKSGHPIKDRSPAVEVSPELLAAELLKKVQKHVLSNYEDVGTELARESLKIHYGLEEPRNIRGTSTAEEEKMLKKEGIELLKIPMPVKSDKN